MTYTQKERMSQVLSPLGDDVLLLRHLTLREKISGMFNGEVELLSLDETIQFTDVVGKPLAISIQLQDKSQRWFHGIVSRFSQAEGQQRFISYRAELVPTLWTLTRRTNCRIYQHMSVPDICKKIFGELGLSDFKLELSESYLPLEYCVQYRETDFDFVSRLLEDSGIGYYFEHEEKAHTLVLFDSPSANAPCPGQSTALYETASGMGVAGDVRKLRFERELRPGGYALTDFNFEQPSLSLLTSTSSTVCVGTSSKLEVYDYPGIFMEPPEGEKRVKCRMEAEECASVRVTGESDTAAFTPGYRFDLTGHYARERNEAYLITEVVHSLSESAGHDTTGLTTYENSFSCMPHSIPFRPARTTPRPIIQGIQTATVVGAAGKEIDVDSHARVIVQFHWDREGKRDERSSCRVRVSQLWAGKSWGGIAIPRIGQEVIVEFLEGDPDRPLITGRVYNGEQVAPFPLPAGAVNSGIKSRSTPGGGGYNEFSMNDTKGKEQIVVHAQYDMISTIEHDETNVIHNNRSTTVDVDHTESVGNNQTQSVGVDRKASVGANETLSVGANQEESVGGNRTLSISGNDAVSVGGNRTVDAGGSYDMSAGSNLSTTSGANTEITAGANVTVSAGAKLTLTAGGSTIEISAAGITISSVAPITVTGATIKLN